MLIGELALLELGLELIVEHLLEDIFETAVINLEDGVLGREIDRVVAGEAIIETGARKFADRLVEIVHGHGNTAARRLEDLVLDHLAVLADKLDRELALAGETKIRGA